MRDDAGIDAGIKIAQIGHDAGQQGALRHRLRGGEEDALRTQPLGFGADRRPRGLAINDALDVLMSVNAVEHENLLTEMAAVE